MVSVIMQGHNLLSIPRIGADKFRKIWGNNAPRKLVVEIGTDRKRLDELPTVLFLSDSLILTKPPNTFIIIANNKAIKVKVQLYTLNELLKLPSVGISDRFLGT